MNLDGLIERLQEIREYTGKNIPICIGDSFDWHNNNMIITMVCLESLNGTDKVVSIITERPFYSHIKDKVTVNHY